MGHSTMRVLSSFVRLQEYSICCIKLYFQTLCVCSCDNIACCVDNKVNHMINGLNVKTFLTSDILFYISCGLPTVSLLKYGS